MPGQTPTRAKPTTKGKSRSREMLKLKLQTALRKRFPHDTVDISDGFEGNIHVVVVSRAFDRMGERGQQAELWKLIDNAGLTDAEKSLVSLVYAVSPGELK